MGYKKVSTYPKGYSGSGKEVGEAKAARKAYAKEYGRTAGTLTYQKQARTGKTKRTETPEEKKAEIERNTKIASDSITFYGGKRAAKNAASKEADYAIGQNYTRAAIKDALGAVGSLPVAGFLAVAGAEAPLALGAALTVVGGNTIYQAVRTFGANKEIRKEMETKKAYIDDSNYGHDYVVSQDERQRK